MTTLDPKLVDPKAHKPNNHNGFTTAIFTGK